MKNIIYIIWNKKESDYELKTYKWYMTRLNCQKRVNIYNKYDPNTYEVKEVELKLK